MTMNLFDQNLIHTVLLEIDSQLKQGMLPVDDRHLAHLCKEGEVLEYLFYLKTRGLISANVVKKGVEGTLHKMVNIRLTYLGMKSL
jgi:hypothetical protein